MSFLSMTKTLFKSLIHGPYTGKYPIEKREFFENTRGSVNIDIDDCIFCGLCQRRCPTGAISVEKANGSWSINRLSCIQCSYCTEACPKKCLNMNGQYSAPSFESVKDEFKNARVPDNKENN